MTFHVLVLFSCYLSVISDAFVLPSLHLQPKTPVAFISHHLGSSTTFTQCQAHKSKNGASAPKSSKRKKQPQKQQKEKEAARSLKKLPFTDDPLAFIELDDNDNKKDASPRAGSPHGANFIECFADSLATIQGIPYTIGSPCDYAVALCFFDTDGELVPIELDDVYMEEVFPVAERIVEEEFGEELCLLRTPQTLTLVGELEEDEDDDEGDEYEEEDDDEDDDSEEVETLLSFDHEGMEIHLVRLVDPVLLVGKVDETNPNRRILLSKEEADRIMPQLEEMFVEYYDRE